MSKSKQKITYVTSCVLYGYKKPDKAYKQIKQKIICMTLGGLHTY